MKELVFPSTTFILEIEVYSDIDYLAMLWVRSPPWVNKPHISRSLKMGPRCKQAAGTHQQWLSTFSHKLSNLDASFHTYTSVDSSGVGLGEWLGFLAKGPKGCSPALKRRVLPFPAWPTDLHSKPQYDSSYSSVANLAVAVLDSWREAFSWHGVQNVVLLSLVALGESLSGITARSTPSATDITIQRWDWCRVL